MSLAKIATVLEAGATIICVSVLANEFSSSFSQEEKTLPVDVPSNKNEKAFDGGGEF